MTPATSTCTSSPTPRWAAAGGCRRARGGLSAAAQAGRVRAGRACSLPLLTLCWPAVRGQLNLTSDVLVFLVAVIAVALVGGLVPAVLAAVAASLLLNFYFTPPLHTFTIAEANNVLALVVFVVVALVVSVRGRRRRAADQAGGPAPAPSPSCSSRTAGSVLRGEQALAGGARPGARGVRHGLGDAAGTRGRRGRQPAPRTGRRLARWSRLGRARAAARPGRRRRGRAGRRRALPGAARPAAAGRPTAGCSAPSPPTPRSTLEQQRLAAAAEAAEPIAEADRMRDRAARGGQPRPAHPAGRRRRQPSASLRPATPPGSPRSAGTELLATADESLDQLTRLVDNLLDMSRLQAGELPLHPRRPTVVDGRRRSTRWTSLGPPSSEIRVMIPAATPPDSMSILPCSNACWSTCCPTRSGTRPLIPRHG